MIPVLERWGWPCPFWPAESDGFLLPVTTAQAGALAWALIGRHVTADDLSLTVNSAVEAIEAYVTAPPDEVFAPGGLRVSRGDAVVLPGCCHGLDEWREWFGALRGQPVYLGHSPDVLLEDQGSVWRLWQDPEASQVHVDIPRAALAGLLRGVHRDLLGFLGSLRRWSREVAPEHVELFVSAVDERLSVTSPLPELLNY